jgi:hypothetical protein
MSSELISWTITLEIVLPFIILSVVLILNNLNQKKKTKAAVRELILKVKTNETRQRENLAEYLTKKLEFNEAKAKDTIKVIINERKFLFRNLISGILDKNFTALTCLEEDLSRITDHYHSMEFELSTSVDTPEPDAAEPNEDNQEKITELKKEIKALKHEIHVTLSTLNNIFGEFSSMFGEEVPDKELSVDQIITAMETFSTNSDSGVAENTADSSAQTNNNNEGEFDVIAGDAEEAIEAIDEINLESDIDIEGDIDIEAEEGVEAETSQDSSSQDTASESDEEKLNFDSELDDIDSALDDLELGQAPLAENKTESESEVEKSDSTKINIDIEQTLTEEQNQEGDEEPSWDDAFEESGDTKSDEK